MNCALAKLGHCIFCGCTNNHCQEVNTNMQEDYDGPQTLGPPLCHEIFLFWLEYCAAISLITVFQLINTRAHLDFTGNNIGDTNSCTTTRLKGERPCLLSQACHVQARQQRGISLQGLSLAKGNQRHEIRRRLAQLS